ncbi:hypothetical protein [Micromonospora sp. NPDC023956]|uniref:hypothetical protein n=1 Tax=Micromonospora sp. NPDC023956 TaxID=3155722 RepID=UPI0033D22F7A
MTRALPATIAAALLCTVLTGCGPKDTEPAAAPPTIKAAGTITVDLPHFAWNPGEGCWGREDHEQLRAGATVTVHDNTGTTVGMGKLAEGTVTMQPDGEKAQNCTFAFEVGDVPAGRKFYSIEVVGEERVQVSEGDLGRVRLRLG